MAAGNLNAGLGQIANSLASDSRSLDQLKRSARDDPRQAAKQVATQFEAMFMQMVLKSMRDATPSNGLLDSHEQDMYRGMLDQQIAQQVAARGTGLSDVIARQLTRNLSAAASTAASIAAPGAASGSGAVAGAGGATSPQPAAAAGSPTASSTGSAGAQSQAQRTFMQQHWADAVRAQQLTGVPAGFILGQAALESGWGQKEIRGADGSPSYNLFGIKAGPGWQGKTVQVTTTEFVGGVAQKSVQSFRAYDSYTAAFQDWALTIGRNQRYSAAALPGVNAGGFAAAMQQAGYSTDPSYAQKLANVIQAATALRGA